MPAGFSLSDFAYLLPEFVLTGGALIVLLADVLPAEARHGAIAVGSRSRAWRDRGGARAARSANRRRSRAA